MPFVAGEFGKAAIIFHSLPIESDIRTNIVIRSVGSLRDVVAAGSFERVVSKTVVV